MRIGLNSPQALLALVIRRRWWIIAPFLALSCVVSVLTISLPKTYVSEALILVRPREVPANFVVDLIAGSVEDRLKLIEQTVLSRTNLVAIIREFGDKLPEFQRLNMEQKVNKLHGQIDISFQGGTSVDPRGQKTISYFRIIYQNQNPEYAQKIASRLTTLFIEEDNSNREDQVIGARDFFARALEKVNADLEANSERLKSMKAGRQFELPERLETNLRQLDILTSQATTVEESIGRIVTQRLNTEQALNETPATQLIRGTTVASLAAVPAAVPVLPEDVKITDYRKAKAAYEQISALYPARNPDVLAMKGIMEQQGKKLTPEELEIAAKPPVVPAPVAAPVAVAGMAPGTEPIPAYTRLVASLATLETDHKLLLERKADIARQIEVYTRRVENTPQVEQELADVVRENADLQKEYDDLKDKLTQAELSASLESEQKAGQFEVADNANLPSTPAKPKKMMVALAGSGLSLVLALLFAGVVDIARQRIWTQSEIEAFWGVPVLVDIPEIPTDADMAAVRKKKWLFAASAAGAAMIFSICLYGVHLKHEFILRQLDPVLQKVIYK
jgi:succinoglycan biosynthesis transport protein ExoP